MVVEPCRRQTRLGDPTTTATVTVAGPCQRHARRGDETGHGNGTGRDDEARMVDASGGSPSQMAWPP